MQAPLGATQPYALSSPLPCAPCAAPARLSQQLGALQVRGRIADTAAAAEGHRRRRSRLLTVRVQKPALLHSQLGGLVPCSHSLCCPAAHPRPPPVSQPPPLAPPALDAAPGRRGAAQPVHARPPRRRAGRGQHQPPGRARAGGRGALARQGLARSARCASAMPAAPSAPLTSLTLLPPRPSPERRTLARATPRRASWAATLRRRCWATTTRTTSSSEGGWGWLGGEGAGGWYWMGGAATAELLSLRSVCWRLLLASQQWSQPRPALVPG